MGYFDSPKNRAMWERELDTLRRDRQARKDGVQAEPAAVQREAQRQQPARERVTYTQLLLEERDDRLQRFHQKRTAPTLSRSLEHEKKGPEL